MTVSGIYTEENDVTPAPQGGSAIGSADAVKEVCPACLGRGGHWRDVYVVDGWSIAWDDCPFGCKTPRDPSLQREALAEAPSSAAGVDNKDRAP